MMRLISGISATQGKSHTPSGDGKQGSPVSDSVYYEDVPDHDLLDTMEVIHAQKVTLTNSKIEHEVAAIHCGRMFHCLMVPSIVISAFLAVITIVLSSFSKEFIEQISASLNAFNAILLGLSGLMKFQSKMEAHEVAVQSCVALICECDELEMTIENYSKGMLGEWLKHNKDDKKMTQFLTSLPQKIKSIAVRHTDVETMCPSTTSFSRKARKLLKDFRDDDIKWLGNMEEHNMEIHNSFLLPVDSEEESANSEEEPQPPEALAPSLPGVAREEPPQPETPPPLAVTENMKGPAGSPGSVANGPLSRLPPPSVPPLPRHLQLPPPSVPSPSYTSAAEATKPAEAEAPTPAAEEAKPEAAPAVTKEEARPAEAPALAAEEAKPAEAEGPPPAAEEAKPEAAPAATKEEAKPAEAPAPAAEEAKPAEAEGPLPAAEEAKPEAPLPPLGGGAGHGGTRYIGAASGTAFNTQAPGPLDKVPPQVRRRIEELGLQDAGIENVAKLKTVLTQMGMSPEESDVQAVFDEATEEASGTLSLFGLLAYLYREESAQEPAQRPDRVPPVELD